MKEARGVPGETGGRYLIASDGYRAEVVEFVPAWATVYWYLQDDPRQRADWSSLVGYSHKPENKMSKSN